MKLTKTADEILAAKTVVYCPVEYGPNELFPSFNGKIVTHGVNSKTFNDVVRDTIGVSINGSTEECINNVLKLAPVLDGWTVTNPFGKNRENYPTATLFLGLKKKNGAYDFKINIPESDLHYVTKSQNVIVTSTPALYFDPIKKNVGFYLRINYLEFDVDAIKTVKQYMD